MVSIFLSVCYLGPLRLVAFLTISHFFNEIQPKSNHRSLKVEKLYTFDDSNYLVLFYRKFQLNIIYFIAICFDLFLSYKETSDKIYLKLFGYLIFFIPYQLLQTSKLNENIFATDFQFISVTKLHCYISIITFLNILYFHFTDYNFKMLLVSIGCVLILLFTNVENEKNSDYKLQNFLKNFINSKYMLQYYKTNFILINLFVLIVIFLNKSMDPNFKFSEAFLPFIKQNIFSLMFNIIIIYCLNLDLNRLPKIDNLKNQVQQKPYTTSFFSLFIQLINSGESKSIFNFLLLNVAFMFIQLLYSFRSKSLSLLSDSLHMLLDCTSLFLGLLASIIAKNNNENPNTKYPFGLSRIGTLSGFTNGSLLLGIVFGIFNESIQRFFNPVTLENTTELLIVSFLGFLVNLVGIFAFNHGHDHSHGHSHGHSHSHTHSHTHSQSHNDTHINKQNENNSCDKKDECNTHDHEHQHQHQNIQEEVKEAEIEIDGDSCNENDDDSEPIENDDNMHGIFLHIMADTLGSVGVIISTIIVKITGWSFIDPLTSIMIATLIFISSIPLLKSSSSNLLLSLNDNTEKELEYLLTEVLNIPGVKSYTTPRFWPQDGPNSKLVGYLHVQYYRTDNSLHIKTKIDRLFDKSSSVKTLYLQMENEIDECWCRKDGIFCNN